MRMHYYHFVYLGSALGTHVAWPSHLVVERSNETQDNKRTGKKLFKENQVMNVDLSTLPPTLLALYCLLYKLFKDVGLRVTLDVQVFGHEIKLFFLMRPDVIPFCNMEPITGGCIVAYIWEMKEKNTLGKFLFVNPFVVAHGVKDEDRVRALSQRLLAAASNQIILVLCNVGGHWIITIVQLEKNIISLMDPLAHRIKDTIWKSVVDMI